jgi:hypothetical protein
MDGRAARLFFVFTKALSASFFVNLAFFTPVLPYSIKVTV